MTKKCAVCKETKTHSEFHKDKTRKDNLTTQCKDCRKVIAMKRRKANPDAGRDYSLRYKYGITLDDKIQMIAETGGDCPVCHKKVEEFRDWCVDHNHDTGFIRGVLCRQCNAVAGYFKDDPTAIRRLADFYERGA